MYPLGLFEWGLARASDKRTQAFSYTRSHHKNYSDGKRVFRSLNVIITPTGGLELRVVYDSGDGKTFTDLLLFQSTRFEQQELARVLSTVRRWAENVDPSETEKVSWKSDDQRGCTVRILDGFVYKLFDFRFGRSQTRDPTIAISNNLYPDLKVSFCFVFQSYLSADLLGI
jgi:hypothetical protein